MINYGIYIKIFILTPENMCVLKNTMLNWYRRAFIKCLCLHRLWLFPQTDGGRCDPFSPRPANWFCSPSQAQDPKGKCNPFFSNRYSIIYFTLSQKGLSVKCLWKSASSIEATFSLDSSHSSLILKTKIWEIYQTHT